MGCGFYDPILGPRPPEEECFHDGGDRGPRAGIGPDGQLHGLDPEDTIGEYTDAAGRRRVVPSNRICLCSPRFAVLRSNLPLSRYEAAVGVQGSVGIRGQNLMEQRMPSLQERQFAELKSDLRPATANRGSNNHRASADWCAWRCWTRNNLI